MLAALVLFTFFATHTASAQFLVGGGLAFSTGASYTGLDAGGIGIQANGNYLLNEEQGIRLAADVTIFFPDDQFGIDISFFTINTNGHYIFSTSETLMAYALAGLNFAVVSWDANVPVVGFNTSFSDTSVGLNAGAGAEYEVGFGYLYGEAKVVLGGADAFVLGFGIRVPVGN